MKRGLIILAMIITLGASSAMGQWTKYSGCINLNNVTGVDTTFAYTAFPNRDDVYNGGWSVVVYDGAIRSDSLQAEVVAGSRAADLFAIEIGDWPYTLGTDSILVNGTWRSGQGVYDDVLPFRLLGVRYSKLDATVQTLTTDSVCWDIMVYER